MVTAWDPTPGLPVWSADDAPSAPRPGTQLSTYCNKYDKPGGVPRRERTSGYGAGTCRSGMGSAAKSRCAGLAMSRAHWVDRDTRALSVDRPVLANICR